MSLNTDRSVPVNLRQSGAPRIDMLIGTRVRKSPFWHKSVDHGVRAATVYNRMYHPRLYFSPDQGGLMGEYKYLTEHVTLWNVAVERQIQVRGPDATALIDYLVTRGMTGDKELAPGKARYVVLCNEEGGIVNDPVLLRVEEEEYWLSISDSDVLLWIQGLNHGLGYDVEIRELDVAPVQLQGPKSKAMLKSLLGDEIDGLKFFNLLQTRLAGCDVVISRTGFSGETGYEIYLRNATRDADRLWDALIEAGEAFELRVIAPGHISRIESGILSYGQDLDLETSPYEVGLDWQVDLDKEAFVGKEALSRIAKEGVDHKLVGLVFGDRAITWYNADFWTVRDSDREGAAQIGFVTSAFFSPRLESNIALARLPVEKNKVGTEVYIDLPGSPDPVRAKVASVPFHDPPRGLNRPSGAMSV